MFLLKFVGKNVFLLKFSLTVMLLFVSINVQFSVVECYHEKEVQWKTAAKNGGSL